MVSQGATCCDMVMKHDVLCNKHVFQNTVRNARAVARLDQARAIRDVANKSKMWSSVIHLNSNNVFIEAFFVNPVLVARKLEVDFVFVDDTSSSNDFCLSLISLLCRDLSNAVHSLAWGVLKNRTTESFVRFFSFVQRFSHQLIRLCATGISHSKRESPACLGIPRMYYIVASTWRGTSSPTRDMLQCSPVISGTCGTPEQASRNPNSWTP